MKQVALGRTNLMFIGCVHAGYRAANLMSLVSSAERTALDVFPYVKDDLGRPLNGNADYESLRPDIWKAANPEAVRVYRVEECRSTAGAQSIKRARRRFAKRR